MAIAIVIVAQRNTQNVIYVQNSRLLSLSASGHPATIAIIAFADIQFVSMMSPMRHDTMPIAPITHSHKAHEKQYPFVRTTNSNNAICKLHEPKCTLIEMHHSETYNNLERKNDGVLCCVLFGLMPSPSTKKPRNLVLGRERSFMCGGNCVEEAFERIWIATMKQRYMSHNGRPVSLSLWRREHHA